MKEFLNTYKKLSSDNLSLLSEIYAPEIVFTDPAHEIRGLEQLTRYFRNLYTNIDSINFEFSSPLQQEDKGYVQWKMTFSHPKLRKGSDITVAGATFLHFEDSGKVIYHRDYFDLGSMLYQHIPLLGRVIQSINRRLGT